MLLEDTQNFFSKKNSSFGGFGAHQLDPQTVSYPNHPRSVFPSAPASWHLGYRTLPKGNDLGFCCFSMFLVAFQRGDFFGGLFLRCFCLGTLQIRESWPVASALGSF